MPFLSPADIAGALYGVSRVLRFDKDGLEYFDSSARGLIKSFWMAAALLPLYILHLGLDLALISGQDLAPHPVRILAVMLIFYVIDWVAFPLAMLMLAEVIGVGQRVFHFLVPFNWFQFVANGVIILFGMAASLHLMPADVQFIAIIATLIYTTYLARQGLEVPWWSAVGVTVLFSVVSIFFMTVAYGLITR